MIDQDTIFLLGEEERLERIPHRLYESEGLLQDLIETHPDLLVGEQIDPDRPPRWLMVQREAGIPDSDGGNDRWSIDHLLLDQHGRPTLVEVKRSTDTRIRREVVGQMLDYAANARKYWPQERIRELAAQHTGGLENLERQIRELLADEEADIEDFWDVVDRNLREGELRLLLVADEIPTELRRIIEFLNEQMPGIEVLGIEIRQYQRGGTRVLVPRVVGQTESARQAKRTSRRKPKLTRDQFLAASKQWSRQFFEGLLVEAGRLSLAVNWGTTGFSLRARRADGTWTTLGYGVVPGYYDDSQHDTVFEVALSAYEPEDRPERLREELLKKEFVREHRPDILLVDPGQARSTDPRQVIGEVLSIGEIIATSSHS